MKLNLGCGQKKLEGFVNVDNNPTAHPDVRHDLNIFPYPFEDNTFSYMLMDHVLEHLDDPLLVIQELYRIAKPDGTIRILSPHFSCNWLHPGHKSAISTMLFDYFKSSNNDDFYGNCSFTTLLLKMIYLRNPNLWGLPGRLINKIISSAANFHPGFCQRIWCYWVGGFEEIEFIVKAVK